MEIGNNLALDGSIDMLVDAYVWGAQVELSSGATSYIPTQAATVARGADLALVSDMTWLNEQAGTLYLDFDVGDVKAGKHIIEMSRATKVTVANRHC